MNKLRLLTGLGILVSLIFPEVYATGLKPDPATVLAPNAPAASPSIAGTPKSVGRRHILFRGMIAAVDERARTFTIAGKDHTRVVKITESTVITKTGQPATMKDVVVDLEVRGSYYKLPDESLEARTVKLGPLTDSDKTARGTRRDKPEDQVTSEKEGGTSPSPAVSS